MYRGAEKVFFRPLMAFGIPAEAGNQSLKDFLDSRFPGSKHFEGQHYGGQVLFLAIGSIDIKC